MEKPSSWLEWVLSGFPLIMCHCHIIIRHNKSQNNLNIFQTLAVKLFGKLITNIIREE